MEQIARVEALAAAIPVVLARRDEDWPEFAGRTARAISERLSDAGWQLTRVGDEERSRAVVDAARKWRGDFNKRGYGVEPRNEYEVHALSLIKAVDALDAASQPPSPAACPVCGASNSHTYIGGEDYPDHRWQPPSPTSQGEER